MKLSEFLAANADVYEGLTALQAAAALNAKTQTGDVPASDVKKYLLLTGEWPNIVLSTSISAVSLREALDAFEDFDLEDSAVLDAVGGVLTGLVDDSLIAGASKDAILAMGASRRSIAEVHGFVATLGKLQAIGVR